MTEWALVFRDLGDLASALIDDEWRPADGQFLANYDLDARDGRGIANWTSDPTVALRWGSFKDALEAWRTVCPSRPLRPDGQPNRPLTAFTVELTQL